MNPLPQPWAAPSRRRSPTDRELPAAGRTAPPPAWPSGHRPTPEEAATWARLWALPQAVAWEQLPGVGEVVARYCRLTVVVSSQLNDGDVKAATLGQLRALEADLGLSPVALARLRWRIVETPTTSVSRSGRPQPTPRRMRALDPPGAARGQQD